MIGALAAAAGGLSTGATIGIWLGRRELRRIFDVVDRMPGAEWFQRVEKKIDRLDPERILAYFDRVRVHNDMITRHEDAIEMLRENVEDHEQRIRVIERAKGA